MNARITGATAVRVLRQLRSDRRTVAMIVVLPSAILALLRWIYAGQRSIFDHIAPDLLAIMPFVVMFLVASVATLRERRSGTLERLLTTPMHKLDLLAGYGIAFGSLALLQAAIVTALTFTALGVDAHGAWPALTLTAVSVALLGTAFGLFSSAFAATEFQAVQLLPALVVPQFLLCGLLVPRERLGTGLHAISNVLPLTWAVDAMNQSITYGGLTGRGGRDLAIVAGTAVVALAAGAATLRRRSG